MSERIGNRREPTPANLLRRVIQLGVRGHAYRWIGYFANNIKSTFNTKGGLNYGGRLQIRRPTRNRAQIHNMSWRTFTTTTALFGTCQISKAHTDCLTNPINCFLFFSCIKFLVQTPNQTGPQSFQTLIAQNVVPPPTNILLKVYWPPNSTGPD